ncbi:hypothetical protein Q8G28_03860 [Lysinibacillus capsici]|uniref:hypothetical protein n=1 Tax=Lysinibacillus capsici TaxID=2115968 RepID=UPI0024801477|nr:hypothetical protein [Lysinibacillus capsici]MDP1392007.1 hypothetical protein [Lysinibacillus capsici]MDP1412483.1 hypothetical protein [Lysinibacillus capsici]MDP1428885.1 hypothetical protein [Lysinibacillus capsici]
MYEGKEYISVTVVSNTGGSVISRQKDVDIEFVKLMFKSDYVTVDGMTIKKEAVEVDHYGSVTFYGSQMYRSGDFLNR